MTTELFITDPNNLEGLGPKEIVERLKAGKGKKKFMTYDEMSRSQEHKAAPKEPEVDMVRNVRLMELSDEDFSKIRARMEAKFGSL